MKSPSKELLDFYDKHDTDIEESWQEHLFSNEWGSGGDRIKITDDIFWEFVEEKLENIEVFKK